MLYNSTTDFDLASNKPARFVGLGNYLGIASDGMARSSVQFTVLLAAVALPLEMLLALGIALLIRGVLGERVIRSVILLPMMLPPVVTGIAWKMLFNHDFGPVNYFLSLFGVSKVSWVGSPIFAPLGVIWIDIWQWTPFIFLILYSGLQAQPHEVTEAAKVDGASSWAMTRYIEIPMLVPLMSVAFILRLVDILKLFDIIFMITRGGPGAATHSFSFYIYKVGLSYGWDIGYAAALSVVLLLAVVLLFNVLVRVLRVRQLLELG
jgi:multiple sugar transport system permease protein